MSNSLFIAESTCALLRQAWRENVPGDDVEERQLVVALPVLARSGALGLAWNKIKRRTDLLAVEAGQAVVESARQGALEHIKADDALATLDRQLAARSVDYLLFKGKALGRHYHPGHIRPCGDLDLLVAPDAISTAMDALRPIMASWHDEPEGGISGFLNQPGYPGTGSRIDLHTTLDRFRMPDIEEVFASARITKGLGGRDIRTPSPELHLRLVTVHFLRHGGWRPLWLCDVAAMVESAGGDFDWDACLGRDPRTREWVSATIGLARDFLAADVSGVPEVIDLEVPAWLKSNVLREWSRSDPTRFVHARISDTLAWPAWFWSELRKRWPSPLIATTGLGAAMTGSPRWYLQARLLGRTLVRYAGRTASGTYRH